MPELKPEELLIRLDERLVGFEKTVTMMFNELALKNKEILILLEKKADTHLIKDLQDSITRIENRTDSNTNRIIRLENWKIWLAGVSAATLAIGGFIGMFIEKYLSILK